jgi:hypothetical protein
MAFCKPSMILWSSSAIGKQDEPGHSLDRFINGPIKPQSNSHARKQISSSQPIDALTN